MEEVGHVYIPAHVMARRDINILQKVLYGKIIGLSGKDGYCFASNEWLGEQLGKNQKTISKWVGDLVELGLVKREVLRNEKAEIIKRKLFPVFVELGGGIPEIEHRGIPEIEQGIQENYIQEKRDTPKQKKTSKNSHTPCTDEELRQIAIDLQVPFSSVSNKHAEIVDLIQDGSFSKYGKTVYYTLRKWIRMGLRDGKIKKTQEAQLREMYGSI